MTPKWTTTFEHELFRYVQVNCCYLNIQTHNPRTDTATHTHSDKCVSQEFHKVSPTQIQMPRISFPCLGFSEWFRYYDGLLLLLRYSFQSNQTIHSICKKLVWIESFICCHFVLLHIHINMCMNITGDCVLHNKRMRVHKLFRIVFVLHLTASYWSNINTTEERIPQVNERIKNTRKFRLADGAPCCCFFLCCNALKLSI